jgi:hypothetical protein
MLASNWLAEPTGNLIKAIPDGFPGQPLMPLTIVVDNSVLLLISKHVKNSSKQDIIDSTSPVAGGFHLVVLPVGIRTP